MGSSASSSSTFHEEISQDRKTDSVDSSKNKKNIFDSDAALPFEWSLPSQTRPQQNPFDIPRQEKNPFDNSKQDRNPFDTSPQERNPFVVGGQKPSQNPFDIPPQRNPFDLQRGPNPFEIGKPEQRLPSLDDFLKRTAFDFPTPVNHQQVAQSSNPFMTGSVSTISSFSEIQQPSRAPRMDEKVERIARDPQSNSTVNQTQAQPSQPPKPIRLEANPVGMPLLIAAKECTPPPPKNPRDELSRLFSRRDQDQGPAENTNADRQDRIRRDPMAPAATSAEDEEDLEFDDAEVIDYGADNSMDDDMDFPRGENPNQQDEDNDFSVEDTEVIDYSHDDQYPG